MRKLLICILVVLTTSCVEAPQVTGNDQRLSFGCNDTVVIARVHNESEERASAPNDLLGHSWFSATLKVKRVVRGADVPAFLPVKYFGHAALRQDLDFMLVLRRAAGTYQITTGQLMWVRPHLAERCG